MVAFVNMLQLVLLVVILVDEVGAFVPNAIWRNPLNGCCGFGQESSSTPLLVMKGDQNVDVDDDDDDDDDHDNDGLMMGREESRMMDYVSQYLEKEGYREGSRGAVVASSGSLSSENLEKATHLIAIPMDTCHELLLELESVQRAILYHCPILTDACIPGAATRLPLLYVAASNVKATQVTRLLSQIVNELVQKHVFQEKIAGAEEAEGSEGVIDDESLNADGCRPLTMTFQSLEIDGANNNVLNTVGRPGDDGTAKLGILVRDLKTSVEALGWEAAYPPDPNRLSSSGPDEFRPRVPFMELPREFDANLSALKDKRAEINEEDFEFLTSSQGGNGISPIFWCQWWDDVLGRNIRLKEVGVYPRNLIGSILSSDLGHSSFYMPFETIALPDGNPAMLQTEQNFQKYQNERMGLEEQKSHEGLSVDTDNSNFDPDSLMAKTFDRHERLYNIFGGRDNESGSKEKDADEIFITSDGGLGGTAKTKGGAEYNETTGHLSGGPQKKTSSDDFMDSWMQDRIRQTIESQESERARKPVKKDVPPIEENPVFQAYKEGTLVPKNPAQTFKKDLGAYPSRNHFVGFWKVVSSPTGFPVEESTSESSENLVLRIDGTTAGGPILDQEKRQKAAGGTWKILKGDGGEVKLRIRLLIPPHKDRVLEMIGRVNRISAGSELPVASRAFGVPHLEAMAKKAAGEDVEDFMMCGGEVYLEDAVTKKNREQIGEFCLTKIHGSKSPGEYTITIPKPA